MRRDARNTLTAVFENGVEVGRYDYDRNLIRVRRTTQTENVEYVLDDKHVLNELDGSQAGKPSIRRYHYGTKVLAVTESAGTNFILNDGIGSASDFWSSTGTLAQSRQYDAWGNFRNGTAPGAGEAKVAYTGHQYDPETGWVYAKARYYDSGLGVFLSRDSFEGMLPEAPSLHRYSYAYGNPLRFWDPSGYLTKELEKKIAEAQQRAQQGPPKDSDNLTVEQAIQTGAFQAEYPNVSIETYGTDPFTQTLATVPLQAVAAQAQGYTLAQTALVTTPGAVNLAKTVTSGKPLGAASSWAANPGAARALVPSDATTASKANVTTSVEADAADGLMCKMKPSEPTVTLWRGVNESHAKYAEAQRGEVTPARRWWEFWKKPATPLEHNVAPDGTLRSSRTSWSTNPDVAENFALRPDGEGVVLKAEVPKSRTVESPNLKQVLLKQTKKIVSEDEVQVEGKVKATEVKKVGPYKDE